MRESIYAIAHFKVDPAIGMDIVMEVVFLCEFCWNVAQFDVDVFGPAKRGLEVEVSDVEGDKFGALAGKDAIEE